MKIDIIEKGIVASRAKQMYAWPGITKAQNGDIIVSASERKFHCGPWGREVIIRSTDNGRNWQQPQEIYNSELDDRDANILTLKDGTLLLSWFTSMAFAEHNICPERIARVTDKMQQDLLGTWMIKSYDNGENWNTQALKIPAGMHISPVALSDGSLLSIGWKDKTDNGKILCCYKSKDIGENWYEASEFECPMKEGKSLLNENHVLEVSPGKLIALFRKCDDCLYQASSDNYGESWSKPLQIDIWGCPPHMIKLNDGRILCVVGHRKTPYSIRGVISYDQGLTWDTNNTFTIYEWEDEPDMGYPMSLETAPGEIMTVFYCSRLDANTPNHPAPWTHLDQSGTSPEGILSVRYTL